MSQRLDTAFALLALGLLGAGGWGAVANGLLVAAVAMEAVGPCGRDCTEVRCTMENQGPLRATGTVVIDAWSRGGYEDGTERQEVAYVLEPGARSEIVRAFPGVPFARGSTLVRCRPRGGGGGTGG